MAAEDYIDDSWPDPFDHRGDEDYPDSTYRSSGRRIVTCNRCGAGGFHWGQIHGTWRLFDSDEQLHACRTSQLTNFPRPTPASILASTTVVSQVFPSTSKEPIMDKNAVAFIRNDVISLHVVFSDPSVASGFSKEYHYLTTDSSIDPGDWVIVEVRGIFKCAKVTLAPQELQIEPNSAITYKFIVGKVDTSAYQTLLDSNAKIEDMLKTSYRTTLREGFRQTLLAGLDAEKQASLSLILNTSSKE